MTLFCLILLIAIIELLLTAFFRSMSKALDIKSLAKGIIERIFLCVALINGYPHALTVFSALKLGTRLKMDHSEEITIIDPKIKRGFNFNDFYLIGNFLSVTAAILYVYFIKKYIVTL